MFVCVCEEGRAGVNEGGNKLRLKRVVSVNGQQGRMSSLFLTRLTFKNAASLWDCLRYRKLNGHCVSSLFDRYQQHGGGVLVSVTAKTYNTLFAEEPHYTTVI